MTPRETVLSQEAAEEMGDSGGLTSLLKKLAPGSRGAAGPPALWDQMPQGQSLLQPGCQDLEAGGSCWQRNWGPFPTYPEPVSVGRQGRCLDPPGEMVDMGFGWQKVGLAVPGPAPWSTLAEAPKACG